MSCDVPRAGPSRIERISTPKQHLGRGVPGGSSGPVGGFDAGPRVAGPVGLQFIQLLAELTDLHPYCGIIFFLWHDALIRFGATIVACRHNSWDKVGQLIELAQEQYGVSEVPKLRRGRMVPNASPLDF